MGGSGVLETVHFGASMHTVLGKAIYRLFDVDFVVVFGQPRDFGHGQAAEPKEGNVAANRHPGQVGYSHRPPYQKLEDTASSP
jgi:hypothetical protein